MFNVYGHSVSRLVSLDVIVGRLKPARWDETRQTNDETGIVTLRRYTVTEYAHQNW